MSTIRLKVIYGGGEVNTLLDRRIETAIEGIGGKWYASGCDIETGERDSCFDVEVEDAGKNSRKKDNSN